MLSGCLASACGQSFANRTDSGVITGCIADREDIGLKGLKKFAALFAVVLLFVLVQPAVNATGSGAVYTEVNETVYATTAVNVRTGPGTSYDRITTLRFGEAVQRIGIGNNGWSKVIYKGEEAYIYSIYLSATVPIETKPNTDYSQLTRQIAIVNGLKQADFTKESWSVLAEALAQANKAMTSDEQDEVDAAQQVLEAAVDTLEKMDYTALEDALRAVRDFGAAHEDSALWSSLVEGVQNGEALLESGDQAAVDVAAAQINEILAALKASLDDQRLPETIIQEVPVEVPPTDDYCNISAHRVWPVLLVISLILNLGLAALIGVYVARKRKKLTDDIPLVDYDIDDDI